MQRVQVKGGYGYGKTLKELLPSDYAKKSTEEAIAEAFSDVYTNRTLASQISKDIVEEAKKLYNLYNKRGGRP